MFRRFWTALRQWADGVTRPTYGCCSGDPIAFEKEALQRARERELGQTHVAHTQPAAAPDPSGGRRPAVS